MNLTHKSSVHERVVEGHDVLKEVVDGGVASNGYFQFRLQLFVRKIIKKLDNFLAAAPSMFKEVISQRG